MEQELNKIWGDWKVDKVLGEGAFGKVYRIEREDFGHTYEAALKVIRIPKNQSEIKSVLNDGMDERSVTMYFHSIVEDIVEEFALMSRLKGNTNIVSYEDHAVVPHEQGIGWDIYIRMELLTPLFDYLREHKWSIRDVICLGIDMCNALEVCQKYNVIHRDIKPENMFVSNLGKFKLGDFGIARQMEKTSSGMSKKGTYTYMAPEVYKGEAYNSTVDIYSLGIVLYRFLNNNRTPFLPDYPTPIRYADKERANIMRMSGEAVPKPCNAEGRLAEIVLKACAFDPKERYESAVDMRKALETVLYEESEAKIIYPKGDILTNSNVEYVSFTSENESSSDDMPKKKINPEKAEIEKAEIEKAEIEKTETAEMKETEETLYLFGKTEAIVREKTKEKAEQQSESEAGQQYKEAQIKIVTEQNETEKNKLKAETEKKETEEKEEEKASENKKARTKGKTESKNSSKKGIAAAAIVLIIGIAGAFGYQTYQKSLEREVPNMSGMTLENAAKTAAGDDNSLTVKQAGEEYSDTIKKGTIISQNVKAGTILKKGDQIGVVVSKGALVEVPKLTGKKTEDAEKTAIDAKLLYTVSSEEYSDEVKKGVVISQDLEAGSTVEEQQTILVVVSKGIEQVTVPDVTGKTLEKAKAALEKAKLTYSTSKDYSSSVTEGKIISQSIDAGKKVDKNKKVKLVVSLGKKPEPKPASSGSSGGSGSAQKKSTTSSSKKKKSSGGGSDDINSWDLVN